MSRMPQSPSQKNSERQVLCRPQIQTLHAKDANQTAAESSRSSSSSPQVVVQEAGRAGTAGRSQWRRRHVLGGERGGAAAPG